MLKSGVDVRPADGKLGVLLPGLGAVSTTFIAGVHAVRKNLGLPIGSLTQMGTIRLGKRTENRVPKISDFVPLAQMSDLEFCAWDPFPENAYAAAKKAAVLDGGLIDSLRPEMEEIVPHTAVFDREFVKRLEGQHVKKAPTKRELAEQLVADIQDFKKKRKLDRMVMVWCGSTEVFRTPEAVHQDLKSFEAGLAKNDAAIAPSQIYAYAALKTGCAYANGAPNLSVDIPALTELAQQRSVPIAGKDFKTGQTLMKTVLAPGLKSRLIGVSGWFSTNILGNRDGEVLDDPESFKSKEVSKLGVLEHIFQPHLYPQLYGDCYHKVRINYYPPRGDAKEAWDNIDLFGWLGYGMKLKVNFLCRDSVLAAPVVLDLALFLDLAQRANMSGVQEWLSFYFKSPMTAPGLYPEHDVFIQLMKLKNTLRYMRGEDLITHLGLEYYD